MSKMTYATISLTFVSENYTFLLLFLDILFIAKSVIANHSAIIEIIIF